MERIYPKASKYRPSNTSRRWLVNYSLIYGGDGGGYQVEWAKSYRSHSGAKAAAWWHYNIGSWGGAVTIHDQATKEASS